MDMHERVTLVVEHEALRLMAVAGGAVSRWGSAPLPAGTLAADGGVANPTMLGQVLERLWSSHSQPNAAAIPLILAIPGRHIVSSLVSVTGADPADPEAMAMKARQAVPRPDAYHGWQVVGPSSQPGLFVVAAPAAIVDSYLTALQLAGLEALAVDVKPLALIRGIGQRNAIIVDGERSVGTIILVEDALPRRVRFPALNAPHLVTQEDRALYLTELVQETIDLHNSEAMGRPLHPGIPLFLTGSLADDPLMREHLRNQVAHPIGQLSPPFEMPGDMPISQFIANVGLAQKRL